VRRIAVAGIAAVAAVDILVADKADADTPVEQDTGQVVEFECTGTVVEW
jgi:hypothetical protein